MPRSLRSSSSLTSTFENKMRNEAFDLVKDDYQRHYQSMIVGSFEQTYRDKSIKEIEDEIIAAYELADACYSFGESIRDNEKTKEIVLKEMKDKFPGFTETTYREALSHGLYISR